LLELGGPTGLDAVKPLLLDHLARQFGLTLQTADPLDFVSLAPQAA
nr:lipoyl(octanoyl) transferase [Pseudomonadota bacterium]